MVERYQKVRGRMAKAARQYGRDPATLRLLAVSKKQDCAKITALAELGQLEFAENYAQELVAKAERLKALNLEWVFIGQLQTNKIKAIVAVAKEVQAVASFHHAQAIARAAEAYGKAAYPIYLALNAGDEPSKGGLNFDAIPLLAAQIRQELPSLSVQGLMSIPPPGLIVTGKEVPPLYHKVASMARSVGRGLLSLGMSGDMEAAIGAGSDCLRVGSDLFGPR